MEQINPYFVRYTSLPTYEDFYKNVMLKNILCVFPKELTQKWKCKKCWIKKDNMIDFDYFIKHYGNMQCPVYKCNETYFNSNPCSTISLEDYINYWKNVIEFNYEYEQNKLDTLYLKDWHLFSSYQKELEASDENIEKIFDLPQYFEADYLNDYCAAEKLTDYKFVYLGPKNSSTPLHIDVFGSFSWSANICGKKRWLFIPEPNVSHFKRLLGTELPQSLYNLENFREIYESVQAFEIIQNHGEVIFVPSGYMHEVMNLEDTISINHNWFNSCNLYRIFYSLLDAYNDVKSEISHLKEDLSKDEWIEKCDSILVVHFGMNFDTFRKIILYNLEKIGHHQSLLPKFASFRHEKDVEILKSVLFHLDEVIKLL